MHPTAGVFAGLILIGFVRFALLGKGSPSGKAAAYLAALLVVWGVIEAKNPAAGSMIASGFGDGLSALADSLGYVISHL